MERAETELAAARREIARLERELAARDDGTVLEAASEWRRAIDAIHDPIFIHDTDFRIIRANRAYAERAGMDVKEVLGRRYWDVFPTQRAPLESCVRALHAGEGEMEEELEFESGRTYHVRSFMVTEETGHHRYTVHILRDVTARKKVEREVQAQEQRIRRGLIQSVQALGHAIEKRDPYTAGHQGRVADIAAAIAERIGLENDRVEGLRMGSMIHDIGKLAIPAEILNRPGPLSEVELRMIRMHPRAGYEIVEDVDYPWPVAEMILQHHERLDGSGYPRGLDGDDILEEARILAVADVVEAMTSHRPYRPALGPEVALREIEGGRGRLYDPDVVDAWLRVAREGHVGP
jgi:PAS domain S-box-containing protein